MLSLRTIFHAFASVLFVAAAVTTNGTMEAETVNWVGVQSGIPPERCCMSVAYDGATLSTVLFGGTVPGQLYGDTWIFGAGGWSQVSPATSPSPRLGAAIAYDAAAGNVVLFGGTTISIPGTAGTYLNDTWTWDGTTWTQQFPPVSPSPRDGSMVYDAATGTVVLFGGGNSSGVLGDTWTWDGLTGTWTQKNPAASPSPRSAPTAYDAVTKTVVLFGGNNGTECFTNTWNWTGTNWVEQFPATAPSARSGASMAYDAAIGAVVLFGGAANDIWEDSLNDTWTWNGTHWHEINPAAVPPNRYAFGMDYDPAPKAVLMFGGYSSGPARGDTWALELEP